MWVKFWYNIVCSTSSEPEVNETYQWVSDRSSNDELRETARELVPDWIQYESNFKYGFVKVDSLPEIVKEQLIKKHQEAIDYHTFMLAKVQES